MPLLQRQLKSRSQSPHSQFSWMETLRTCNNNVEAEDVVLIDVDDESFNNVNVDLPENLPKKQCSNGIKNAKKFPSGTYIFIDDDDESPGNCHGSVHSPNTHFAWENISPVRLSKCKRTYPGRGPKNSYGFSMQSDGDSSDGGPDCEFMVDSSGMLKEQWERASLKRKANVINNQCGITENDGISRFNGDTSKDFGVGQNKQSYAVFSSRSDSNEVTHEKGQCTVVTADKSDEKVTTSSEEELEAKLIPNASNTNGVIVSSSTVNEREKLKETDEYKLEIEEELSARQRALKEEEDQWLQHLLKRRKAEELRLLDTERRQTQRVEERRKTLKKDKEKMNLKEKYRTQVQRELNKLEATCHDMVSLLRALGIVIDNGPSASHQVRAAYKQALLRFHPDRVSQSDIRQQVEAEEKFKLISHMKDRVL